MTVYKKGISGMSLKDNMRAGEVEKVGNSCSDNSRSSMGYHIKNN